MALNVGAATQSDSTPIYISPDANMIRLALDELPGTRRRMNFDLKALGASQSIRVLATVKGPLADDELLAVLKSIALLDRAKPIVGPRSLSIAASRQYAHVTLHPLWNCRGNADKGREWWLWNDSARWTVSDESEEFRFEMCDPVE